MANGPPTPPPTTATELHDEARESIPTPSIPEASSAPVRQETFHYKFPAIMEAALHDNFQELIHVAEQADLTVCSYFLHLLQGIG